MGRCLAFRGLIDLEILILWTFQTGLAMWTCGDLEYRTSGAARERQKDSKWRGCRRVGFQAKALRDGGS